MGSGFIAASVATTLIIALRGTVPNFWSIVVGNALLAAVYGILWAGARKFDGKTVSIPLTGDNGLLDRPDLCTAGSPSDRDGNNRYRLHAARGL
jgi:hypothetical protein